MLHKGVDNMGAEAILKLPQIFDKYKMSMIMLYM